MNSMVTLLLVMDIVAVASMDPRKRDELFCSFVLNNTHGVIEASDFLRRWIQA